MIVSFVLLRNTFGDPASTEKSSQRRTVAKPGRGLLSNEEGNAEQRRVGRSMFELIKDEKRRVESKFKNVCCPIDCLLSEDDPDMKEAQQEAFPEEYAAMTWGKPISKTSSSKLV